MKTLIQTRIGLAMALTLALLAGLAPRAEAVSKYWIATSTADWTDTAKWSLSSGGTGGADVPGNNDVAFFDGAGNGNCNIDAAVNVTGSGGINIGAGYSGTITQGAFAITVGSAGWTQAGGTFTGYTTDATKDITINGPAYFTLSGGVFNSTAGTLLLNCKNYNAGAFTNSGGTFNHCNGTVKFDMGGGPAFTISAPAITFYNLTLNGARSSGGTLGASDVLTVNNTFTYTAWDEYGGMPNSLNNGTIDVKGNIVVGSASASRAGGTTVIRMSSTGAQSISGGSATAWLPIIEINKPSGEVTVTGDVYIGGEFRLISGTFTSTSGTLTLGYYGSGNWTHTAGGTFNHNNGTVIFKMPPSWGSSTIIDVMGAETFYNLKFLGARGASVGLSGDTLDVLGKLTTDMWDAYNDLSNGKINNGVLQAEGDVDLLNSVTPLWGPRGGTATVTFKGANNQLVKQITENIPPEGTWTINKSGGTVTLATDLSLSTTGQQLVWTNGALNLSSNTLTVAGATTIYPGATTLGVTVADTNRAGRLMCSSAVNNLTNAGLEVSVAANKNQAAQVRDVTYTVLSNNTSFGTATFESETWLGTWRGSVAYTNNGGKTVTLSNIRFIEGGSVLMVQ